MFEHSFLTRMTLKISTFIVSTLLLAHPLKLLADQSIILRSGNGTVGTQDAQVRFVKYGVGQNTLPTSADFTAAQNGTFAYVDAPYPTYITPAKFSDPLAQWIGTTPALGAGSALYAMPFMVTDPIVAAASLNLGYSVDNNVQGVYINGTAISGNSSDGDYHGEYYFFRSDIASMLKPNSINWLYIKVYDNGGYSGLIFRATITTQGTTPGTPTISPTQGGNAGQVTVQVIGSGFQPAQPNSAGSQLQLTGVGPAIAGLNTNVVSPNLLTSTLSLAGVTPGLRTVTVTNPDGTSISLQNSFTVLQGGGANLQIQKIANEPVAGYNNTVFIAVSNTGNVDSALVPVNEIVAAYYTYVSTNLAPTSTGQESNPIANNVALNSFVWNLEWDLPTVAAGSTVNLAYTAQLNKTYPGGPVAQAA